MTPRDRETGAGSNRPEPVEPAYLIVGRLRRPHGLRGELVMEVLTDFPERLEPGTDLWVGEDYTPVKIRTTRWHGDTLLLSLKGYETPESAGVFRNQLVYVLASSRPALGEGEYYHHELIGMQVISEDGQVLGLLTEILETGANDVYVVQPERGPEILLPAIDSVVVEINLPLKEMRVQVPPGLLQEE